MLPILLTVLMHTTLMQAEFTGDDRELAQGAIERHDLAHREIEPRLWLIATDSGTAAEWEARLSEALPHGSGAFRVRPATPEQVDRVRSGEITLQR